MVRFRLSTSNLAYSEPGSPFPDCREGLTDRLSSSVLLPGIQPRTGRKWDTAITTELIPAPGGCFFFAEEDNFKPQCLPQALPQAFLVLHGLGRPNEFKPAATLRAPEPFWLKVHIGLLLQSRPFVFSMSQASKTHSFHLDNHLLCLVPKLVTTRCSAPVAAKILCC